MKMNWLNGLYIKEMDFDAFMDYAKPFIQKTKVAGKYDMIKLCKLLQGRIEFFGEIGDKVDFLEEFGEYDTELYLNQKQKSDKDVAIAVLPKVLETLNKVETWENSALYDALKNLAVSLNLKNSQILWPTRIAISGRDSTPGGATELAELIGKNETLKRLKFSIELLNK